MGETVAQASLYERYRVQPGARVHLAQRDPDDTGPYARRSESAKDLDAARQRIEHFQELLWAEHRRSLLVVLQAMDTGGKDGAIRDVFGGVNPQGCRVAAFKVPTPEELDHNFLWRCHARTPGRGTIGIFNRSHYEDVLVVRVHELVPPEVWKPRYDLINQFEELLVHTDTTILKFFLHISKEEQKQRLEARRDDPEKAWKFSLADIKERQHWDEYMAAYEEVLSRCSTDQSPWFVVPADKKWYRNVVVASVVADTLERLDPRPPAPEPGIEAVEVPD
jgi:PPK2 family polyphosphate:nucleotide phosphotransferase